MISFYKITEVFYDLDLVFRENNVKKNPLAPFWPECRGRTIRAGLPVQKPGQPFSDHGPTQSFSTDLSVQV